MAVGDSGFRFFWVFWVFLFYYSEAELQGKMVVLFFNFFFFYLEEPLSILLFIVAMFTFPPTIGILTNNCYLLTF